jgi:hypothetical protein
VTFTPIQGSLEPSLDPVTSLICAPWLVQRRTPTQRFFSSAISLIIADV